MAKNTRKRVNPRPVITGPNRQKTKDLPVFDGQPVRSPLACMYFDRLVSRASFYTKKGAKYYVYRISCATSGCTGSVSLKSVKSCGSLVCVRCAHKAKRKGPFFQQWQRLAKTASKRNLTANITREQFVDLCAVTRCFYCMQLLDRAVSGGAAYVKGSYSLLLDRIDSKKGYDHKNCVPCCPLCNWTKGPYITVNEMCLVMAMRRRDLQDIDLIKSNWPFSWQNIQNRMDRAGKIRF